MRLLMKLLLRIAAALVILALGLLTPVAYTELACNGDTSAAPYAPILTDPAWQREEARTLLTYPEWHIVHAYDDYARVIRSGDPHQFAYLSSIGGYWASLCALKKAASAHGGVSTKTRQLVYTIGVSFTAEFLAKAAYEESLGRIFSAIDGTTRAPLEDLSAAQAAEYARFLQQVPWYRWDFRADIAALDAARTERLRDRERALALGIEFRVKAAYARVISNAVANVGADELRIRSVVAGITPDQLVGMDGISLVEARAEGIVIETPRYRSFTALLAQLSEKGATIVEIAGNDDVLLTATAPADTESTALHRFARQGYSDERHLILVKAADLAEVLRGLKTRGMMLEHIHDY